MTIDEPGKIQITLYPVVRDLCHEDFGWKTWPTPRPGQTGTAALHAGSPEFRYATLAIALPRPNVNCALHNVTITLRFGADGGCDDFIRPAFPKARFYATLDIRDIFGHTQGDPMSTRTGIEWTDATWNPVTGCTRVSKGCENCYAATLASRLLRSSYLARSPVVDSDIARADPFAVRVWPERLTQPEKWHEPRMIFVNSMSDLFHAHVPTDFGRRVFATMLRANWHTYQVLTKRPARALRFWKNNRDLFGGGPFPPHIWLGASVEDQSVAYRVRHLRSIPAAVRFLSCEPLLGPLRLDLTGIHWLIAGGESGPVRRPMASEWVIELRNQCQAADVPFFFKQWGGRTPKAGGRELEGRLWNDMPREVAG